jgi:hypothetical protein
MSLATKVGRFCLGGIVMTMKGVKTWLMPRPLCPLSVLEET